MKENVFRTYRDAHLYACDIDDMAITITRYGDKYIVGIDPAYNPGSHESSLDRKARLRNDKINSILGE